jgi:hypothetical protein
VAKEPNYISIMEEIIAEEEQIIEDIVEEEIVPLIKYQQEQENKAFDKAYKEYQELKEV